jgi:hypothetical protein
MAEEVELKTPPGSTILRSAKPKGEGATKKLPLCERRSRAAKKSHPIRQPLLFS